MNFLTTGDFLHKVSRKIAIVCFIGFVILGAIVHFSPVLGLDVAISTELQEGNNGITQRIMSAISFFGISWVAVTSIIAATLIFLILSYKREAFFIFLTFIADGATVLVKIIVGRPRPVANLVNVFQRLNDPSFPSGHVVHYVVFFGILYAIIFSLWKPKMFYGILISAIIFTMIVSISFSRVYLGAHWATDTLGGYMLGFAMLWTMLHFYFNKRVSAKK